MKKYLTWKIVAIALVTMTILFFDLPPTSQKAIIPFLSAEKPLVPSVNLGLDLQGGSQLDYKIDLRTVPEADKESIIEGVLGVIIKRVNGLGVAEPNIYISNVADETHIIVEIAETANISQTDVDKYLGPGKILANITEDEKKTVSLEKAKETVGKTIQLEFKEKKDQIDPAEADKIKENAQASLNKILKGAEFAVIGQEEQQAYPGKAVYDRPDFTFEKNIPEKLKDTLTSLEDGGIAKKLIETGGSFVVDESGQAVEDKGLAIVKLVTTKEEIQNKKEVEVSHILISYKDATRADASVTRTKDEAYTLAKEVKDKLDKGGDFAILAQQYSDDSSNKENGGKLDTPVTGTGTYVYDFEQASLKLTKEGELSDIVPTEFGYHIIKANKVSSDVKAKQYKYETITYSLLPDPWKDTGLTGKNFVHAEVQLDNFYQPYITIQFDEEGGRLFEEITGRNVNKPIAIFVGGNLISAPNVNEKISGGSAQITGKFTPDEAKALARDLNTGAIPAPIVLNGEYTIGATLGHEALNKSLWAGLIGIILVMAFMIFYYRIPGVIASLALFFYGAITFFLIKAQLHLGLALLVALGIFIYLIVKVLSNKDSGWEKALAFVLSCFAFFFITYLLKTGVVLTLAGIAGLIMSVGMAVDANVLIFERFKEELKSGKTFASAMETGFEKAWSAIRDSNFTTLLICLVLFSFGSSTIKGFAFNLAIGVLVSMFSAITITRTLMMGLIGRPITQNLKLMGVKEKALRIVPFMKYAKTWISISIVSFVIAVIAIAISGLNLGLDFTGGTLMEYKFSEAVTKETLATTFKDIGIQFNEEGITTTPSAAADTGSGSVMLSTNTTSEGEAIDFSTIQIIPSGENGYIIKTKYISSDVHDKLLSRLKEKLPEFSEKRFTTIGPTVGKSMLGAAMKAVLIALLIIALYVAFAFRKVPKEVSTWRFGATAIIALVHDVTIVTGIFAILGVVLKVEIDALFITAMLTVFGYSVNDTIVIFDKIRENLIHSNKDEKIEHLVDRSLNETMTRSLNTGLTTVFALIAILIFGSSSIFYFVLALAIGITLGTYSSIFVASPMLVWWTNWARRNK